MKNQNPKNLISYIIWKTGNQFSKIPRITRRIPLYLKFLLKGQYKALRIFTHLTIEEKNLLYSLSRKLEPGSNIVEIGSYLGSSANFLAQGGKKCRVFCVDTWQNDTMPEGKRDTFWEFQKNTKKYNNIITLRGKSEEAVKNFKEKIDLLFIDSDHSYQGAKTDVDCWLPKCQDEAILVFHDIGWAEGVNRIIEQEIKPIENKVLKILPNMYVSQIKKSPPIIK